MNLRSFVEGLTTQEREELLDILTQQSELSSTMPPFIRNTVKEEELRASSDNTFTMNKSIDPSSKKRKEAVKAKANTWTDTGEDSHIKTPEIQKTPRTRTPPRKVVVTCSACGKNFEEDSRFVYGEFMRCSSCASRN